jgi:thymidylate synthase ThyX
VAYNARVLLDSTSPAGVRLTTLEVTFPRFVLAEFNTHRRFSRNSASSRAIPTSKLIERVLKDPAVPLEWGKNKAGMSASDVLLGDLAQEAQRVWLGARDAAVAHAQRLLDLDVHKQELNRLLEPFLWHTVIVSATEWENFFELRCAPNAQPEIRAAALLMRDAMSASVPQTLDDGQWHTPLLQPDESSLDPETRRRVSAARCARVSYLTHQGQREIERDLELYERLRADRHLSPFEHVATPAHGVSGKLPRLDSDAPRYRDDNRQRGQQRSPRRQLDRKPQGVVSAAQCRVISPLQRYELACGIDGRHRGWRRQFGWRKLETIDGRRNRAERDEARPQLQAQLREDRRNYQQAREKELFCSPHGNPGNGQNAQRDGRNRALSSRRPPCHERNRGDGKTELFLMEKRAGDHAAERGNENDQRATLQLRARSRRDNQRCRQEKKV